MSNCRFSVFLIDSHFFAVNRMPSNCAFDGSLIFGYISTDYANIDTVDGMFFDLLCNVYVTSSFLHTIREPVVSISIR